MSAGRLRWPSMVGPSARTFDGPRWLVSAGGLRAPWRLLLFIAALLAGSFGAQAVVYPAIDVVARLTGVRIVAWPWLLLIAAVAAHALVLRGVERRPWADVAAGRSAWRLRPLLNGSAYGLLAVAVVAGALLAAGALRILPAAPASAGELLLLAGRLLLFLAPAALYEELVFRGYLWHIAEEAAGPTTALVATSAAFAVVHLGNPGAGVRSLAVVFAAGLALGAVRRATGSLGAAWLAHLAWNWGLAGLLHAPVSGLPFEAVGWRTESAGPAWLGGGAWGPEGGVAAALVFLAGGHLLWWGGVIPRLGPGREVSGHAASAAATAGPPAPPAS